MPKIKLHWSLLFLVVLLVFNMRAIVPILEKQGGLPEIAGYAVLALLSLAFVGAILVHELSHVFVGEKFFGIKTRQITLMLFGGMAQMGPIKQGKQEFFVGIVGPLTSFAIGALFYLVSTQLSQYSIAAFFLFLFAWLNLAVAVFNIFPIFPLDGGRVFRAILGIFCSRVKATKIAAAVGIVGGIILTVVSLWQFGLNSALWIGIIMAAFIIPVNLQLFRDPNMDA